MKLKIVFHVEDADTKEIIVEKSQTVIDVSDQSGGFSIANLARDHRAETVKSLESAKDSGILSESEKTKLAAIQYEESQVEEFLIAAGDIIQRYIRLKLRDWARRLLAKEPAIGP